MINPPFDALDYLSLHIFPSINDCFNVMRECQSVSHLTLGLGMLFYPIPPAIIASLIEVYLPNLQSFHIMSHAGIIRFLNRITLPRLKKFRIEFMWGVFEEEEEELTCMDG